MQKALTRGHHIQGSRHGEKYRNCGNPPANRCRLQICLKCQGFSSLLAHSVTGCTGNGETTSHTDMVPSFVYSRLAMARSWSEHSVLVQDNSDYWRCGKQEWGELQVAVLKPSHCCKIVLGNNRDHKVTAWETSLKFQCSLCTKQTLCTKYIIHWNTMKASQSDTWYRRVDILADGALFQLQPEHQAHVFDLPSTAYANLYWSVWQENLQLVEHPQMIHQKDDVAFAELLGRRVRKNTLHHTRHQSPKTREIHHDHLVYNSFMRR